ncbi:MAG: PilZ domain-containing protein [Deltaproteobacteria bacterium]|nr:PilZ domain-containing protein [Deltaproteobacteria bacterium]
MRYSDREKVGDACLPCQEGKIYAMTKEEERRDAPRAPSRLEVEVWGSSGENEITDLSVTGAFIYTDTSSRFKPDDEVDLVLKFPTEDEAMLVKGRIRRVTERGVGIEFLKLTSEYINVIAKYYRSLRRAKPPEDT